MIKTKEERQQILESCRSRIGGKSKPLLFMLFSGVASCSNCKLKFYDSLSLKLLPGAHLGWDKTYEKVAERFYWPQLSNDVKSLVMSSPECQLNWWTKWNLTKNQHLFILCQSMHPKSGIYRASIACSCHKFAGVNYAFLSIGKNWTITWNEERAPLYMWSH